MERTNQKPGFELKRSDIRNLKKQLQKPFDTHVVCNLANWQVTRRSGKCQDGKRALTEGDEDEQGFLVLDADLWDDAS
jgi:hypothetical protein